MTKIIELTVKTGERTQMIDITGDILKLVQNSGISHGLCHVYCPHTTAGITINENADPTVITDMLNTLNKLIPVDKSYLHREGNSDAHIKAALIGASETLFIQNGTLRLGTWQGIYFCEFDGPRNRRVWIKLST
ncbi:secondary thiamine-phosphate synthase enzyme [Desulfohalotomaculum tongense]|uniref:secondary thiamine-phosphate synthase enzyme YjbQ n=1 Tax=Desulforadius tongensis TaxID=1216062 RepID=UPI00195A2FC0|nr:secondary thiamine-phosphate synthase enzyme YjbQ [Desulforadius tongensis]MBM7855814.1 secondary thiamine-phosphate synthase enzyme [Desulforadius tongensis]